MVDSTAAGDAFVGGLLYRLAGLDLPAQALDSLARGALEDTLKFASACGAYAVQKRGAFTSLPARKGLAGRMID